MKFIKSKKRLVIFFALISGFLGQLAMDIYLPSMPSMREIFATSNAHIQLTYSYFMLGFGISVLSYGFFSHRVNYRFIFLSCNALFLLATLLILVSTNIYELIFFRMIQGVGAGIGSVVVIIALIRLLFKKKVLGSMISYTVFILTVAAIVAPLFGGLIQEYYGWTGNFMLLFIIAFFLSLTSYFWLPEVKFAHPKGEYSFFKTVHKLFLNKGYISHILYSIITLNILVSYYIMSPFILETQFGSSPLVYGWTAALICLLFSIGSLLNGFLLNKYPQTTMIWWGLVLSMVGTFTLLVSSYFFASVLAMVLPMLVLALGLGILYPNFVAKGFENIYSSITIATSLFGILKITLIFLNTSIAAVLPDTFQSCAWLIFCMYLLLVTVLCIFNREYFFRK